VSLYLKKINTNKLFALDDHYFKVHLNKAPATEIFAEVTAEATKISNLGSLNKI
jgi:hypothetical protein